MTAVHLGLFFLGWLIGKRDFYLQELKTKGKSFGKRTGRGVVFFWGDRSFTKLQEACTLSIPRLLQGRVCSLWAGTEFWSKTLTPSKLRLGNFGRFRVTLTWFHCVFMPGELWVQPKAHLEVTPSSDSQSSFPCTAQVSNLNLSRLVRKQSREPLLAFSEAQSYLFHHSKTCVSCLLESKVKALRFILTLLKWVPSLFTHLPRRPCSLLHIRWLMWWRELVMGVLGKEFLPISREIGSESQLVTSTESTVLILYSSAKGQGNRIVGINVYGMEEQSMSWNSPNTAMLWTGLCLSWSS